jgi:biopolymer transport protein ExbD
MNFRPRRDEEPEINLISMIDILLVLLIFFIMSTTFAVDGRLRIQFPQASSVPLQRSPADALIITVTAEGNFLVNGFEVINSSPDTLRLAIQKVAGERRDAPVTLRADGRATHQAVVTAMDTLGKLGFAQLRILTTSSDEVARS